MQDFKIPKFKEQVIPQMENLLKSLVLLGLLVGSFFLAQAGVNAIDSYFLNTPSLLHFVLKWTLVSVLALFNGVLIMGLALLGHEGIHWVLFKNKFWNDLWGGLLAAFVLIPYYDFRDFHFTHHGHTHQPGVDPEELMNNRPFWFALLGGFVLGISSRYKIIATNVLIGSSEKRAEGLKDVFFLSVAGVCYFYLAPMAGLSLWYTTIPTLLLIPIVFAFRNVAEHHGIPPQFRKSANQTGKLDVDSWIVLTNPLMNWLWSHINYHQVHHRYPYLSHRYLPAVFEATKYEQPYAVVKGYLRSIMNLRTRQYYSAPEELKPFLVSDNLAESV